MTSRRRAGGRASVAVPAWLWAALAAVLVGVGCAAAVREVPTVGVACCLSASLGCAFECGWLAREERR